MREPMHTLWPMGSERDAVTQFHQDEKPAGYHGVSDWQASSDTLFRGYSKTPSGPSESAPNSPIRLASNIVHYHQGRRQLRYTTVKDDRNMTRVTVMR